MKPHLLFVALLVVINSCKSSIETENDAKIADSSAVTIIGDIGSEQFLNDLLGTQSLVRGFKFGTPIDSILQNETLELFEEVPSHVGFVYERANLESADILYMRDTKNKLIGIDIDIYLNSEASADALLATTKGHFNSLYTPSPKDSLTWMIDRGGFLKIKQVKTPLDNGLELKFRQ